MTRLVIDPVTRVGGGLRVELELEGGVVTDAWSSATTFRGLERVLPGRDPRDAWLLAARICGEANGIHALASVRAVERALGVAIPPNARLVRNLLAGSQFIVNHVTSFYGRAAFDWVDVGAAATADPAATERLARSIGSAPRSESPYFRRARERLGAAVADGWAAPFGGGPWGHPAYRLTPAADLLIAAHHLEALDWRRQMTRLQAYLGGKSTHPQTFLVGGMALVPPWTGPTLPSTGEHPRPIERSSSLALSLPGLASMANLIRGAREFVETVYLPDVLLLGREYRDWAAVGRGSRNFLSFGEFPEDGSTEPRLVLPRGRVMDRDLTTVGTVGEGGVAESVVHSHYEEDGEALRGPGDGRTEPRYSGPPAPVTTIADSAKYSWAKAPRYDDDPMEVGPLARMAVAYARGGGTLAGEAVVDALDELGFAPEMLLGTLGRTVARALEAKVVADRLEGWIVELGENLAARDTAVANLSGWDPGRWPGEAVGFSLGESPQGALGHWLTIRDRRISGYQVVDGSTWNASPRDARGRRGAMEAALIGTPVADPDRPLEILRTIHSFDPCMACAVH